MSSSAVFFWLSFGMFVGQYLVTLSFLLIISGLTVFASALSSSWDAFPMTDFSFLVLWVLV